MGQLDITVSDQVIMELPIVWVLGGPGSGKGTQCDLMAVKYGYNHLSSGELLRTEVTSGSSRGMQLFSIMQNGQLVPDEEIVNLIAEAIEIKKGETKGFIIDGFPATVVQAKLFVEKVGPPTRILVLEVSDDIMKIRLKQRSNFDDQPDAILRRMTTFTEQTRPVIQEFMKTVKQVKADRTAEDIFTDIIKIMDN